MRCAGCTAELCKRRGVRLVPRLRELCATRTDYATLLDRLHGIVDELVIPESGQPNGAVPQRPQPIGERVGDAFRDVVKSLGISKLGGCGCNSVKAKMNSLGVAGCRENRDQLIATLRENASKVGWTKKLIAVPLSIWTGLAFVVNPLDPIPGLFDEAILRCEVQRAR